MFLRRRHSAFLQIAPISRTASARCLFFCKCPGLARQQRPVIFLPIARIGPPPLRPLSKTIQPAFAAFCPVSKLHPFFVPCIFSAQISRLAKLHSFLHFSFVCKNQHFFVYRNFKGVFGFFIFAPIFQKQEFFCARQKSDSILTTQKGGDFSF